MLQCKKNLEELQEQRDVLGREVDYKMNRMMNHLQKLKQDMLSDINDIIDQKELITQYASNFQTFIGIKEMEHVEDSRTVLAGLSDSEDLDYISLRLEQKEQMETLLTSVQLFGDIKVTTSLHGMPIETSRIQQAQFMAPSKPPIQLNLQQKIDLESDRYCGGCILSNGLIIVSCCKNWQLKLINSD